MKLLPWITKKRVTVEHDSGVKYHCDVCRSYFWISNSTEKEMGRKRLIDGWLGKHEHWYSKVARKEREAAADRDEARVSRLYHKMIDAKEGVKT